MGLSSAGSWYDENGMAKDFRSTPFPELQKLIVEFYFRATASSFIERTSLVSVRLRGSNVPRFKKVLRKKRKKRKEAERKEKAAVEDEACNGWEHAKANTEA